MTPPIATTDLVSDWMHRGTTTPDLLAVLRTATTPRANLVPSPDEPPRASVDEFIAWLNSEEFSDDIRAAAWRD